MSYINNYIEWLKVLHYSEHTINSYQKILFDFHNTFKNYLDLTYKDFNNYILHLKGSGYSNATLNKCISALRSFYKYLLKHKIIKASDVFLLSFYKSNVRLDVIDIKDINILLDSKNFSDTFLGVRNLLILELLYDTGIRVNELVNIKISDVNLYDYRILVLGKGQKERYVIFGSKCKLLILKYFNLRKRFLGTSNSDYLILNNKKTNFSNSGIRYVINSISNKLGIEKHLYPHLFRHTIASHLHNNGADTKFIQQFLGHSKIETTAHYVYVSFESLKNCYCKCHTRFYMKGWRNNLKKEDIAFIRSLVNSKALKFYVENNFIYCESLISHERIVVGEC